jgi:hypothetical protein
MDRCSPPPLDHQGHKRHKGHRLITLRDNDGSSTPPFHCVYHLALAPPGPPDSGDEAMIAQEDATVLLFDVPMQFHKQVVVEWLDGTRLPESASTPEGMALLSSVMRVLDFLGADALVDGIARELAEAVQERKVKMKDALAACNHELAFTRALADVYDRPLPRFRLAPPDARPTHFVAALVKPGGVVERVEVAHRDALASIARLLYAGPMRRPEEMVLPADCLGFREVLYTGTNVTAYGDAQEDSDAHLDDSSDEDSDAHPDDSSDEDSDAHPQHLLRVQDTKVEGTELLSVQATNVEGTVQVYFDKSRRHPYDALPASFMHPHVVAGNVVCVLRWKHLVYGDDCDNYYFTNHPEPEPWLDCDGFASLPEPWIRDELWRVLGKWIAGGHKVLIDMEPNENLVNTLIRLMDVKKALRHATEVSYGRYDYWVKKVKVFGDVPQF